MPEISRFFGIVIAMFFNDHPHSHFHARYSGQRAIVAIETFPFLEGDLSPRVLGWLPNAAGAPLRIDGKLAARTSVEALIPIAPLE